MTLLLSSTILGFDLISSRILITFKSTLIELKLKFNQIVEFQIWQFANGLVLGLNHNIVLESNQFQNMQKIYHPMISVNDNDEDD